MRRIYMDHSATTPLRQEAFDAMLPYLKGNFGNASSIHSFGRESRAALDQARRTIADTIGSKPGEIIFTSGGTEADNLVLFGIARAYRSKGKHIITTRIEHQAVLHTCEQLESIGYEITYLPVDQYGRVSIEELENQVREDTILVSIMYGNNETGTIQPIKEIGEFLREKEVVFHTDAVQVYGMERIQVDELKIDLLSVSGHKINGPKGTGFLYVRSGTLLQPVFYGGAQERNRRAGTENIAGIVGLAKASELAGKEHEEKHAEMKTLRNDFIQQLKKADIRFEVNGHPDYTLPHILNVSFLGIRADSMLMNLDLEGIAASSGSACSAGSLQPSHVLQAMTADEERILSAIRFSLGLGNNKEEIEDVVDKVKRICQRLKSHEAGVGGEQG